MKPTLTISGKGEAGKEMGKEKGHVTLHVQMTAERSTGQNQSQGQLDGQIAKFQESVSGQKSSLENPAQCASITTSNSFPALVPEKVDVILVKAKSFFVLCIALTLMVIMLFPMTLLIRCPILSLLFNSFLTTVLWFCWTALPPPTSGSSSNSSGSRRSFHYFLKCACVLAVIWVNIDSIPHICRIAYSSGFIYERPQSTNPANLPTETIEGEIPTDRLTQNFFHLKIYQLFGMGDYPMGANLNVPEKVYFITDGRLN